MNGPIAIEGAAPGDTLQIDLLSFQPAHWGWTASIPGFGLLADEFPDPAYRVTRVPGIGERAEFLPGIRLPIVPFCGELGVAPETGPRSTIPPDLHGGNMDTRHLTAGATLFLPTFHAGARFSIGDGHAAQGDGEVCGTAIETPKVASVRLTVRSDLHLRAPEFLTAPGAAAETPVGMRYDGVIPPARPVAASMERAVATAGAMCVMDWNRTPRSPIASRSRLAVPPEDAMSTTSGIGRRRGAGRRLARPASMVCKRMGPWKTNSTT